MGRSRRPGGAGLPIPFGVVLGRVVAIAARLLGRVRGYGCAASTLARVTAGHPLGVTLGPSLLTGGVVLTATRAVCLARFLCTHPATEAGDSDDAA